MNIGILIINDMLYDMETSRKIFQNHKIKANNFILLILLSNQKKYSNYYQR